MVFLFVAAALGLTAQAQAQEPEPAHGHTELAVISSVRGPLGPAAIAAAYLPTPRLAVGMALGHSTSQAIWGHDEDTRLALFSRYHFVNQSHFRLGLGMLYSEGSYYLPGHAYWNRGARVDATAVVDWVLGSVSLRLEGGVGRMLGHPEYSPHAPAGSTPQWFPNLQLAVAVRPGERPAGSADPAPAPLTVVRLFVTGALWTGGGPGCDCGGYDYEGRHSLGLDADLFRQVSKHWRLGVGGRVEIGRGESQTAILGLIPLLFAPFYRWEQTGEEVELAFGFGPSFGEMQVGRTMDTAVNMGGLGFEASLSYSRPISKNLSVVVGTGLRAILASASKVDDTHTRGSYVSFPSRIGVRW